MQQSSFRQIKRLISETNYNPKTVAMECIWLYGLMSLGFDVIGLFV